MQTLSCLPCCGVLEIVRWNREEVEDVYRRSVPFINVQNFIVSNIFKLNFMNFSLV